MGKLRNLNTKIEKEPEPIEWAAQMLGKAAAQQIDQAMLDTLRQAGHGVGQSNLQQTQQAINQQANQALNNMLNAQNSQFAARGLQNTGLHAAARSGISNLMGGGAIGGSGGMLGGLGAGSGLGSIFTGKKGAI